MRYRCNLKLHSHVSQTEVDVIEDIEEYQTIPGVIILVLRIIVMICFILSLRDTMSHEYNPDRLHFFLHFGAASLVRAYPASVRWPEQAVAKPSKLQVWFIYLPLMAVVALQISALWRTKFILGITYSADTFAYIVIMHLLWPSRKEQYFLLAAQVRIVFFFSDESLYPAILCRMTVWTN